jgi:transposase
MIPASVRIFVCTEPVDMRFGFDRLSQVAREKLGRDPISGGALFIFAGKSATRIKILWVEGRGMCLLYKRLHRAVFELPVSADGTRSIQIDGDELAKLLAGVARNTRERKKIITTSHVA